MIFWSIVFLLGASQAALLAVALWRRPANRSANRVLAGWIGLIGFDLVVKSLYFSAPGPEYYKLYRFVGLLPFLYGSLFYLYVSVLTESRTLRPRDALHLAGFLFALLVKAGVFLQGQDELAAWFARGGRHSPSLWFDIALFGYSLSYVIAALLCVRRYRRGLLERRADADRLSLHWIDTMAAFQVLIWCIATLQWLTRIPWIDYPLIYGGVVLWVFAVGYLSLGQAALPVSPEPVPDGPAETGPAAAVATAAPERDDARLPAVERRLAELMHEQQLYREPALTIGQLARRSGYPEYLVSAAINRGAGNFWDYVNRLRIDAVRRQLDDAADTRTLLDIAYASGFTSKSTFNAAFKRLLGETPSAYRERQMRAVRSGGG